MLPRSPQKSGLPLLFSYFVLTLKPHGTKAAVRACVHREMLSYGHRLLSVLSQKHLHFVMLPQNVPYYSIFVFPKKINGEMPQSFIASVLCFWATRLFSSDGQCGFAKQTYFSSEIIGDKTKKSAQNCTDFCNRSKKNPIIRRKRLNVCRMGFGVSQHRLPQPLF